MPVPHASSSESFPTRFLPASLSFSLVTIPINLKVLMIPGFDSRYKCNFSMVCPLTDSRCSFLFFSLSFGYTEEVREPLADAIGEILGAKLEIKKYEF